MTLQDDLSRSRNAEERQETETFELKKKSPGYYLYILQRENALAGVYGLARCHPSCAWSVRTSPILYNRASDILILHTYLDGSCPFTYLGASAVGLFHCTATLSPEEPGRLYGPMGRAPSKYFPVPLRPSGWVGHLFCRFSALTLTLFTYIWQFTSWFTS
ncbi:uncharacterized protein STEHIDRAFT_52003 [Stereum hirsutum FP-91666 SS1]|uniref:uncharacterized protein n=1 Tax=Stereum hirsutum (strain FP-91666) TaxID=721885 RepID=UPI000440C35F|nr:uncharacterized protein STEHIDRAFT_52003 [Stereum hirsutum FP-91666 SS1]EIM90260.1 hypothetical protein STEHIDRAFT_52003 [Stereum hirsutum FP-91666 SS1]